MHNDKGDASSLASYTPYPTPSLTEPLPFFFVRNGVTNNEIHGIIRRHMARLVPSLNPTPKERESGTVGGAAAVAGGGDQGAQEAGISTTRYQYCS